MENKTTSTLEELMRNNFARCCSPTQSLFAMKYAFYSSLYPGVSNSEIWKKIINDIVKQKNLYAQSHAYMTSFSLCQCVTTSHIPFCIADGIAVSIRGHVRATEFLDIIALIDDTNDVYKIAKYSVCLASLFLSLVLKISLS